MDRDARVGAADARHLHHLMVVELRVFHGQRDGRGKMADVVVVMLLVKTSQQHALAGRLGKLQLRVSDVCGRRALQVSKSCAPREWLHRAAMGDVRREASRRSSGRRVRRRSAGQKKKSGGRRAEPRSAEWDERRRGQWPAAEREREGKKAKKKRGRVRTKDANETGAGPS